MRCGSPVRSIALPRSSRAVSAPSTTRAGFAVRAARSVVVRVVLMAVLLRGGWASPVGALWWGRPASGRGVTGPAAVTPAVAPGSRGRTARGEVWTTTELLAARFDRQRVRLRGTGVPGARLGGRRRGRGAGGLDPAAAPATSRSTTWTLADDGRRPDQPQRAARAPDRGTGRGARWPDLVVTATTTTGAAGAGGRRGGRGAAGGAGRVVARPSGWRSCCTTRSPCRSTRSRRCSHRRRPRRGSWPSRARRRVRGGATPRADLAAQRHVVDAFFAAGQAGRLADLAAVLHDDVVLRTDGGGRTADRARVRPQWPAGHARTPTPPAGSTRPS